MPEVPRHQVVDAVARSDGDVERVDAGRTRHAGNLTRAPFGDLEALAR
jgi:hypothetical protein